MVSGANSQGNRRCYLEIRTISHRKIFFLRLLLEPFLSPSRYELAISFRFQQAPKAKMAAAGGDPCSHFASD
jgi:hypothetical protein